MNKSIYHNITCITTIVVVFNCLVHIPESHLLVHKQIPLLQNLYIYITKLIQKPTSSGLL